jgi:hypothetical protein
MIKISELKRQILIKKKGESKEAQKKVKILKISKNNVKSLKLIDLELM